MIFGSGEINGTVKWNLTSNIFYYINTGKYYFRIFGTVNGYDVDCTDDSIL